ncbi:MAG TPA: AAA family ATPase [Frankiaceae bacterium]|nr:AAA family ATPase [Frankiaceae bacterium]
MARATVPPGGSEPARLVETLTAVLLFLGERAYKLKKAADLGFLDFTSREARQAACYAEVALNRRLAPDVYLGVADVLGPDGSPCDHLVVMRRMPDDRRLSTLVRRGAAVDDELRALARLLAGFHSRCRTSAEITRAGGVAAVRGLWDEGLDQLARFAGTVLDAATLDEIGRRARDYLAGRGPLLAARQRAGLVRDGHGDLLADDVFCLPDGPRVLDCLEFDERLRVGDVLGDVAFLVMDLERLGAPGAARRFLDWYREFSAEAHPPSLAHLYVAYRAFVRAKVACLRAGQGDPEAAAEARRLAGMSVDHLRRGRVRLVLVGGLPGTGKTTLAAELARHSDGWTLISSDVVRKELAGRRVLDPARGAVGEGLYRPEAVRATYGEMLRRARCALGLGESVVLDATWVSAGRRGEAAAVAARTASELVELRCEAPEAVALERIANRAEEAGPSEATAEVYHRLATLADPWPSAAVVPTAGARTAVRRVVERAVA